MTSKGQNSLNQNNVNNKPDVFETLNFVSQLMENYNLEPHPDYWATDDSVWLYDTKNDIDIEISDKFLEYTFNNNIVDYDGERGAKYSLHDIFDYYSKLPNELKKGMTSLHLDNKGLNTLEGVYHGQESDVHLNPNSFQSDESSPFRVLTHEVIHAHDDNHSDEFQISSKKEWKNAVDKYPPSTPYAEMVKREEPYAYYSESLAEAGSIYITSKINPNYASINLGNGQKITSKTYREQYPEIWKELEKQYKKMF